jgi:anthranilate phosphoribosyltransferase
MRVENAEESMAMVMQALQGKSGPAYEIVALNAGAALYVAGLADSVGAGIERAREVIGSGAARDKVDEYVAFTRSVAG